MEEIVFIVYFEGDRFGYVESGGEVVGWGNSRNKDMRLKIIEFCFVRCSFVWLEGKVC